MGGNDIFHCALNEGQGLNKPTDQRNVQGKFQLQITYYGLWRVCVACNLVPRALELFSRLHNKDSGCEIAWRGKLFDLHWLCRFLSSPMNGKNFHPV